MGVRKRNAADKRKEEQRSVAFAKLLNIPTSPRKMRYVADMVRGVEVNRALGILKFSNKEAAARVEKLLRSAIANWEAKNERKAFKKAYKKEIVKRSAVMRIVAAWIITVPATAVLAAVLFQMVSAVLR